MKVVLTKEEVVLLITKYGVMEFPALQQFKGEATISVTVRPKKGDWWITVEQEAK